jgi:hypothetical protein
LAAALNVRHGEYRAALDRVRDLDEEDTTRSASLLREAIELSACLRRLLPYVTVQQLHEAFGAPGDFGYDTPIGDGLARTYRGES